MNKYTEWNMADGYRCRESLNEEVFRGEAVRVIAGEPVSYFISLEDYNEKSSREFDLTDFQIIAVLATGKYLLSSQIQAYLGLRGIAVDMDTIGERLHRLLICGMVVQYEFYRRKAVMEDEITDGEKIKVYTASYRGSQFGKRLGAPVINPKEDLMMKDSYGKTNSVCSCVLWNQIILNHLFYREDMLHFRIGKTVSIEGWHTISIPLSIYYRNNNAVFLRVYSREPPSLVSQRAEVVAEYAERAGQDCTLVLVCDSDMHAQWVENCIDIRGRKRCVLAMTSWKEWIGPRQGTVSYYHTFL